MGDGITKSGARVVVRLFDGDLGPILEAALDSEAEEYVRGQMLDALAMLAGEHAPLRPAVADFLRSFPAAVAPEMTPDIVWHAWADAIADLGLADMTPVVRRVYDEGLIDPTLARFEDFEQNLTETLRRRTDPPRPAGAGRSSTPSPSCPAGTASRRLISGTRQRGRGAWRPSISAESCRSSTQTRRWAATIPVRVAAARSSRSAAWIDLSGPRADPGPYCSRRPRGYIRAWAAREGEPMLGPIVGGSAW